MAIDLTRTIAEFQQEAFAKFADRPAFSCLDKTLTFADVDRLSSQFASYLQNQLNLKPGDRLGIQLPNILQYPVVAMGAIKAGLVIVNSNPLYTERELKHQLTDAEVTVLVCVTNLASVAAKVAPETQLQTVITTGIGDLHDEAARDFINEMTNADAPAYSFANEVSLLDALAAGAEQPHELVIRDLEDVAALQYTGGTTGLSKGAVLLQRNVARNWQQVRECTPELWSPGGDTIVVPLPLYHIYAFGTCLVAGLCTGSHSVLIPNPRDLNSFVEVMKKYTVTMFLGINTLFNGLMQNPEFRQLDFSTLRTTVGGGMLTGSDTRAGWKELTGSDVHEGYGLTETSPTVCMTPFGEAKMGSTGVALPMTDVIILGSDGNQQPQGERGEICVKGLQVMAGYHNKPEETAKVMTDDGYFKTGDVGYFDEDGHLFIVDRIKDMILVSGFNVYPNEVEDEINKHPGIVESAAISVPDDKTGEAIKLFVVKSDPDLKAEDIVAFARESLTSYKVPKQVVFKDDLPKSNVGKILRRELRD